MQNLTYEEQAIINILKVNPVTTQEEIATQIGKSFTYKTISYCKKGSRKRLSGTGRK